MAARRKDALDPGLGCKSRLARMLGRQARGDHHRRVGRRGAARDGRDGKRAVADLVVMAVHARDAPSLPHVRMAMGRARLLEALLEARRRHAVVRARGTGQRKLDASEVELDDARIAAVLARPKHALGTRVRLDELDVRGVATGKAQVVEHVVVNREEGRGGSVLRGHVGHAGALRHRERRDAWAKRLDKAAHDALGAQALGHREGKVHGRDAVTELAREVQAHGLGHAHGDGLAQCGRLGLDAANAPSEHADAVGRGRVRVGAHDGVEARELA